MPQLDTVYIFMVYLWTWLMLHLMAQKMKTFMMTKIRMTHDTPTKPTKTLKWL